MLLGQNPRRAVSATPMHCFPAAVVDDAVNRRRGDAPGNLLHLAIQRPAELRTDVDAFRLGKGKPVSSKGKQAVNRAATETRSG